MSQPLVTTEDLTEHPRWRAVLLRALGTGLVAGLIAFAATWAVLAWPTIELTLRWSVGQRPAGAVLQAAEANPVAENHLVIPALAVNAPVFFDTDYTDAVGRLPDGVVHVRGTAYPGDLGNSFFIGHSSGYWWQSGAFNQVFALLDQLETGDTIRLNRSGTTVTYRVIGAHVVRPSDVRVLEQPTDRRLLTLMTCTPVGTSLNRLIVQAELMV